MTVEHGGHYVVRGAGLMNMLHELLGQGVLLY